MDHPLTRGFADTRHGQVHYVSAGSGAPVLLLHQTPRSWDEYRDVIPLLAAAGRRAIAMDTLGFGASARPREPWSIELFADGVVDVIEALGLDGVVVVGHHTGAVVTVEVAARRHPNVAAIVLSGMPYVDAARRERVARRPPVDLVTPAADGSHLLALWNNRAGYYPPDRPDLLDRLVRDCLGVLDRVEEGHVAVNSYRMEERIGEVVAPSLVVCGELDDPSMPDQPQVISALGTEHSATLSGTGVAAVDHAPEQFAAAVVDFLELLAAGRDQVTGLAT